MASYENSIQQLPADVKSMLRTGVALTSLTQCVEELVLNSVDAGATCIAVRVDTSCYKIQILDNGHGISHEEMQNVGQRYWTSKCHSVNDLDNLCYFGYRGEALASLMDISSILEITSRTKISPHSYCKLFQKGKSLSVIESTVPRPSVGTTITAHDLFYNLPVRRKAWNENLEFEQIRQRMEAIALIRPNISFSLRNDCSGNVVLQTHKTNGILNTFSFLFGTTKSKCLLSIQGKSGVFSFDGFIGKESSSRKDHQFVYINKRLVLKTKIHKILNSLLCKSLIVKSKLGSTGNTTQSDLSPTKQVDRYSMFVINVTCPYNEYDITFEPSKTLVEFRNWDVLKTCVEEAVLEFLQRENLVSSQKPECDSNNLPESNDQEEQSEEISCNIKSRNNDDVIMDVACRNDGDDGQVNTGIQNIANKIHTGNIRSALHSKSVSRQKSECSGGVDNEINVGNGFKISQDQNTSNFSEIIDYRTDKECEIDNQNLSCQEQEKCSNNMKTPEKNKIEFKYPSKPRVKYRRHSDDVPKANHIGSPETDFDSEDPIPLNVNTNKSGSACRNEKSTLKASNGNKSVPYIQITMPYISPAGGSSLARFRKMCKKKSSHCDVSNLHENSKSTALSTKRGPYVSSSDIETGEKNSTYHIQDNDSVGKEFYNISEKEVKRTDTVTCKSSTENAIKDIRMDKDSKVMTSESDIDRYNGSVVMAGNTTNICKSKLEDTTFKTYPVVSLSSIPDVGNGASVDMSSLEGYMGQEKLSGIQLVAGSGDVSQVKSTQFEMSKGNGPYVVMATASKRSYQGERETTASKLAKLVQQRNESYHKNASLINLAKSGYPNTKFSEKAKLLEKDNSFTIPLSLEGAFSVKKCNGAQQKTDADSAQRTFLTSDTLIQTREHTSNSVVINSNNKPVVEDISSISFSSSHFTQMCAASNIHSRHNDIVTDVNTRLRCKDVSRSLLYPGDCSKSQGLLTDQSDSQLDNDTFQKTCELTAQPKYSDDNTHQSECNSEEYHPSHFDSVKYQQTHSQSDILHEAYSSCDPFSDANETDLLCHENLDSSSMDFLDSDCGSAELSPPELDMHDQSYAENEDDVFLSNQCSTCDNTVAQSRKNLKLLLSRYSSQDKGGSSRPPVLGLDCISLESIRSQDSTPVQESQGFVPIPQFEQREASSPGGSEGFSPVQCSQVIEYEDTQPFTTSIWADSISESQTLSKNDSSSSVNNTVTEHVSPVSGNTCIDNTVTYDGEATTIEKQTESCFYHEASDTISTTSGSLSISRFLGEDSDHAEQATSTTGTESSATFTKLFSQSESCPDSEHLLEDTLVCKENMFCEEQEVTSQKQINESENINRRGIRNNNIEGTEKSDGVLAASNIVNNQLISNKQLVGHYEQDKDTRDICTENTEKAHVCKECDISNGNMEEIGESVMKNTEDNSLCDKGSSFNDDCEWSDMEDDEIIAAVNISMEQDNHDMGNQWHNRIGHRKRAKLSMFSKKLANREGLPSSSSDAMQKMINEHFDADDELVSVKWNKVSRAESVGNQNSGKSVQDLFDEWENPVFKRPDQDVASAEMGPGRTYAAARAQRSLHPCRFTKSMLQNFKVLGQVDNKFIACLLGNGDQNISAEPTLLVLFDQHAAHERVRLEQLIYDAYDFDSKSNEKSLRTSIVNPSEAITLTEEDVRIMLAFSKEFNRIGIEFSKCDSRNSVLIHKVPACIVEREMNEVKRRRNSVVWNILENLITEHVQLLKSTRGAVGRLPQTIHKLLCSQACHGAVKFGDPLSVSECEELLQALSECKLPFQCAHGRPSVMPLLQTDKINKKYEPKRVNLWKIAKICQPD